MCCPDWFTRTHNRVLFAVMTSCSFWQVRGRVISTQSIQQCLENPDGTKMDSEQETQNHPPITIVPPGTTPSVSREVWDSLFSPLVALVTSPDANEVFRCNGLRSVEEYFAPFGSIRTSGKERTRF